MFIRSITFLPLVALMSANRILVREKRIVGGHKQNIERVPWQVAILDKGDQKCGGVIYQERIVLTAAHCLGRNEDLSVRAGSASQSFGGQEVKVAESIAREGSDMAMLILSSSLKFDDFAKPIELAETSPVAGTNATASGWGMQSFNPVGDVPDHLRAINVTVRDHMRCQTAYNAIAVILAEDPLIIKDNEICASARGGDGGCHGDSGGPLVSVSDQKLIGIASGTFRCLAPGIYVDVALMKDWIEETARRYGF